MKTTPCELQSERLRQIKSGETWLNAPLKERPAVVLHLIPVQTPQDQALCQLPEHPWLLANLPLLHASFSGPVEYDVNGVHRVAKQGDEVVSYMQLFVNGCIEAVDLRLPHYLNSHAETFEKTLLDATRSYLRVQQEMKAIFPVEVTFCLLNAVHTSLGVEDQSLPRERVREWWESGCCGEITDAEVCLRALVASHDDDDLERPMKTVFDSLWRASGYPRSPHYNQAGERGRA
ncbi:MAG: hypothetical protein ABFD94_11190 [Armatimonadia bacterium]